MKNYDRAMRVFPRHGTLLSLSRYKSDGPSEIPLRETRFTIIPEITKPLVDF